MANGRCRVHGGATPRGVASASFVHGRYSKSLPSRLAARYHDALTDATLLQLQDEIALLDTRLADLLARVDSGESGSAWMEAQDALQSFRSAQRIQDAEKRGQRMAEEMSRLSRIVERGSSDYAAWTEIASVLEQRRRLVESERRRLVEAQQMISTGQAMSLIGAIVAIIGENVHDRAILARITRAVDSLIDQEPVGGSRALE